jgi:hypothetical protein
MAFDTTRQCPNAGSVSISIQDFRELFIVSAVGLFVSCHSCGAYSYHETTTLSAYLTYGVRTVTTPSVTAGRL